MTMHSIETAPEWLSAAVRDAADWIGLAAAPTFAFMALFTVIFGGEDTVCAALHASAPDPMIWMYALMSAFHATPWLRLMTGQHGGTRHG